MKAIILAAGKGSRLENPSIPKALTPLVTGKTILGTQLQFLSDYLSLNSVRVVVGYKKEQIIEKYPHITTIINDHYAFENTAKSLLKALDHLNEDTLWINGDVIFHPSVIEQVLKNPRSCMVVNQGVVGKEEVKYRQNKVGEILEVSKTVAKPEGEALGINFFESRDMPTLRESLEKCLSTDYFERGVELCIQQGLKIKTAPIESNLCIEVDFPQDLINANKLIQSWINQGLSI